MKKIYLFFAALFIVIHHVLHASWAEETLQNMDLDHKLGQIFIVPACPSRDSVHLEDLKSLIRQHHIGGLIFKDADPISQASLLHALQKQASIPIICVADAEWGLGMRMQNTISFPKNLTLGAIQNKAILFKLGKEIGRQCKKVGIQVNFAPVVDVNTDFRNPIVHMRAFGDDPKKVAECAEQLIKGMQEEEVLACIKHFPGHGDTHLDSHLELPRISCDLQRLNHIELTPFQKLIDSKVSAVMIGHLLVPALESDPHLPATLSPRIVTDLLQKKMGFEGLVFTDALNMKALTNDFSVGEIAVKALLAGNDCLLYGDHIAPNVDQILRQDVPRAIDALKKAYANGIISIDQINRHALKILKIKEELGLLQNPPRLLTDSDIQELNSKEVKDLRRDLYRQALTCLNDEKKSLPLNPSCIEKVALIQLRKDPSFERLLSRYAQVEVFSLEELDLTIDLKNFSALMISLNSISFNPLDLGISESLKARIEKIANLHPRSSLVLFGTPYCLHRLQLNCPVLIGYEDVPDAHEAAADCLFGKLEASGRLPICLP